MKNENTYEELLSDIFDVWFDGLEEELQLSIIKDINSEYEEIEELSDEEKIQFTLSNELEFGSQEDVFTQIFTKAAENFSGFSFAKDFIQNMSMRATGYGSPLGFFNDLRYGCQSGIIGMLVYDSDCKKIYIEHIDDMEEFRQQLEEELGEPIKNHNLPHYTFMCWLCYEELGRKIAQTLFPDKY